MNDPTIPQNPIPAATPKRTMDPAMLLEMSRVDPSFRKAVHKLLEFGSVWNWNPDDLVGRKGLRIYREMRTRDDDVKNALTIKKLARLSTPYEIQKPNPDIEPRGALMAEFIDYCLNHIIGNFYENLRNILAAVEFGFTVTEINLRYIENGPWKGYVGLKSLKTRASEDFDFLTDDYGDLMTQSVHGRNGIVQRGQPGNNAYLPPDKFLVFTYMGDAGNFYGESDLRACFRNYKSKDSLIKFWNMALERFGMPTLYAQIASPGAATEDDAAAPNQAAIDRIMEILKHLQAGTSAYFPGSVKIEKIEEMRGNAAFQAALEYHSRSITRAILLPSLVTESGQGGSGSYALGKEHSKAFMFVLDHLGLLLSETINEQLIRRLIEWNFPDPQAYPSFTFKPYDTEATTFLADVINKAIVTGTINPEEPWIRDRLGFPPKPETQAIESIVPSSPPAPSEDASVHQAALKAQSDAAAGFIKVIPNRPRALKPLGDPGWNPTDYLIHSIVPYFDAQTQPGDFPSHESLRNYVYLIEGRRKGPDPKKDLALTSFSRPKTDAEEKVDFMEIQKSWRGLYQLTLDKLQAIMDEAKTDLVAKAVAIADTGLPSEIDRLVFKPSLAADFRKAMQDMFLLDFATGVRDAVQEVTKATGKRLAFADAQDPMTPEEALDFMKDKSPTLRRMLAAYNRRAFTVTGVEKERILGEIKNLLTAGMARGASGQSLQNQLGDLFQKYVQSGEVEDGVLLTANRLETIVRTNLGEAYNSGRKGTFEDPEVSQSLEAYQYSAILDARTTEFCAEYDQFTRPINDPVWDMIWPPNHFNCRSLVVPIVDGEEWERTKQSPGLEPAPGFKV